MRCDVYIGMMIDRDVTEKRFENKVGMSTLNTCTAASH